MLFFRVYHIVENQCHRVAKNGNGFVKSNTMFAKVTICFARVPRKLHSSVYFFFFPFGEVFFVVFAAFFGAAFLATAFPFAGAVFPLPFADAFAGAAFLPFDREALRAALFTSFPFPFAPLTL